MILKPVAFCLEDLPEKTKICSIEDLNIVLDFLNIKTRLSGSRYEQIISLELLSKEASTLVDSNSVKRLKDEEETCQFLKKCEEECDRLEVTLANLKKQHSEYEALDKLNINELEEELASLNQNFNDVQFETINMNIIKGVYAFIQGEAVDGDVINSLAYVKKLEGFDFLIKKYELLDDLGMFKIIGMNKSTKVDEICKLMGGDRLETLELLYFLQGADLITFDSQQGTIRLKK